MNSIGTGCVRGEDLGHARTHPAVHLVLFDGHHGAAVARRVDDRGLVHRLDGVVVDDAALDAVLAASRSAATSAL